MSREKRIKQRHREWSEKMIPDEHLEVESFHFNGSLDDLKRACQESFAGTDVKWTVDFVDGNPVIHFHS